MEYLSWASTPNANPSSIHRMFNRGGDHKKAKVPRTELPPDEGKPRIVRFTNCCLLRDHDLVAEDLFVQGGVIADPKKLFWDGQKADVTIDCEGMILAPGFIDLQLNGAFGCDFSTPDGLSESVDKVSAGVLAHGVTAYLPTVITSSAETYQRVMPKLTPRAGRRAAAAGSNLKRRRRPVRESSRAFVLARARSAQCDGRAGGRGHPGRAPGGPLHLA